MPVQHIEFTEYHTPDGLIYKFDTQDRFLLTEEGLGMPPIEYITQTGPFQHGESTLDYRLKPRVIQLLHRENSCSREDYWDNRANWLNMLRPNRSATGVYRLGKLRKYLPDGTVRDIDVRLAEGPIFSPRSLDQWDEYGITETLRFVAPDPTFYDPTASEHVWELTVGEHLIFPITFPIKFGSLVIDTDIAIVYSGTWITYPTITIDGPMEGPIISNLTTGETIHLAYNVATGETITIDLGFGNKTVTSSTGANLIGSVTSDSDLATFHVAPAPEASGGINTVNVIGIGAVIGVSAVTMCFYTRYIGI